nr:septal ring lytic transglycosylase RlpA family protein [Ramlibacter aurantiacus]
MAAAQELPVADPPHSTAAPATPKGVRTGLRQLGQGLASWYGAAFQGKRTASGEPFDMHDLTAAHPWLPFGTLVEVRSLVNGRTVTVRINDRGPFSGRRVIDLSRAAAQKLGLLGRGTKPVEIRIADAAERSADPRP